MSDQVSAGIHGQVADLLADIRDHWQLPEPAWEPVSGLLNELEQALGDGDADRIGAATFELGLAGGWRISRIPTGPVLTPAPPATRDRLNRMVYELGGVTAPVGPATDQAPEPPVRPEADGG